jgi:gas vesicle protein
MDENNLLNELHQSTKKELEQVISQLKEKQQEHKAKEDALKSEFKNLKAEVVDAYVFCEHTVPLITWIILS